MKKHLLSGLTCIVGLVGLLFANSTYAQNKAINFTTNYKYINIPNGGVSSPLNFTNGSFTLEAWINGSLFGNGVHTIMGNDSTFAGISTHAGYALRVKNGRLSFYYSYGSGVREVITTSAVFDTAMWQHVAVTKQGGDITLYVNGMVVASGSFTTNNTIQSSTKTFKIADNGSVDGSIFVGDLDDVKVWNVARTQTEVRADMEELCGSIPSNLIAYYKMDDIGSASSNPIVCASNSTLNGVLNSPITSVTGATRFNGSITTLYVDSSNIATGCAAIDGSSWAKAFPDLNTAIEVAQTHPQITQILVAKGTYHPVNFAYDIKNYGKGCQLKSNSNTDKTFHLRPGIDLFGGYPSGGGVTASPTIYRTILDGAKAGGVVTDTATTVVNMSNPHNNPDTTKLIGVTVRHAVGNAGVTCSGSYGGAVVIANCVITRNGSGNGGAMGIRGNILGSLLIQNDTISNNLGVGIDVVSTAVRVYDNYINANAITGVNIMYGSAEIRRNEIANQTWQGYYQDGGSLIMVDNHIHHNTARGIGLMLLQGASRVDSNIVTNHDSSPNQQGSGIYIYGGISLQVRYNTFKNNISHYGGGIYSFNGTNNIVGNIVENNHANSQGGGMWLQGASNTVSNNIVRNNTSANNAGGIIIDNGINGTTATVANNLIVGNTAQTAAGGIQLGAIRFTLVNNVIANNIAQYDAGAVLTNAVDSGGIVINNTFFNNTATDATFFTTTGGLALTNTTRQTKVYHNIFWKNKIGSSETIANADYRSNTSVKHLFINNAMQLGSTNYTTGTGSGADIGTFASGNFFAVNPQFVSESDAAGADGVLGTPDDGLKLLNSSAFIDAGKNSLFPFTVTTLDVKNEARVTGDSIDLGAYELNCLPANATPQAALHVCKGGATTLRVSSSSPHPGVLWYADSTSTTLLDTGYYYTTPALNVTDTFWVTVNGCAGGKRVPVAVAVHDVTSDTVRVMACDSFYWQPTNTTYKLGGMYTKAYTSVWGCDSVKVLDLTVHHSIVMPPTVISTCDSFLWSVNNKYYTTGGTYTDTLATVNGCDSILTLALSVSSIRASVVLNFAQTELEEIKAKADSYQWLKCDPYQVIPGATSSSYTFPASGRYAVIATKGICTDTSNCIPVVNLGVENTGIDAQLTVKPNPTSGPATVVLPAAFAQGKLQITNAVGQLVVSSEVKAGNVVHIDLGNYPAGLYHVSIWADEKHYTTLLQKE